MGYTFRPMLLSGVWNRLGILIFAAFWVFRSRSVITTA